MMTAGGGGAQPAGASKPSGPGKPWWEGKPCLFLCASKACGTEHHARNAVVCRRCAGALVQTPPGYVSPAKSGKQPLRVVKPNLAGARGPTIPAAAGKREAEVVVINDPPPRSEVTFNPELLTKPNKKQGNHFSYLSAALAGKTSEGGAAAPLTTSAEVTKLQATVTALEALKDLCDPSMLATAKEALDAAQAKSTAAAANAVPFSHTKGHQIRTSLHEFRDSKLKGHRARLEEIEEAAKVLAEQKALVSSAMVEVEATFTKGIKDLETLIATLPPELDGSATVSTAEQLAHRMADSKIAGLQQMETALNGRLTDAGQSLECLSPELQRSIYESMWGVVTSQAVSALAATTKPALPQAAATAAQPSGLVVPVGQPKSVDARAPDAMSEDGSDTDCCPQQPTSATTARADLR